MKPLIDFTLNEYVEKAKDKTSVPGGGSVCALSGALSASLTTMVMKLSDKELDNTEIKDLAKFLQRETNILVKNIDLDSTAFDQVLQAMKLPKETEEEIELRNNKMEQGYIHAIDVPMNTIKSARKIINLQNLLCNRVNKYAMTDIAIGADLALTAANGAAMTIELNMKSLKDEQTKEEYQKELDYFLSAIKYDHDKILSIIRRRLSEL